MTLSPEQIAKNEIGQDGLKKTIEENLQKTEALRQIILMKRLAGSLDCDGHYAQGSPYHS